MRDDFGSIGYDRDVAVSRESKTEATMGRTCLICFRERPNERFGGKGYGARVCKECRKLPKSEQKRRLAENEIVGFLDQKNISANNVNRLLREAADIVCES